LHNRRSIVVWRFNFVPTSVQEAIGFKSLEVKIKIICGDRKEFNESFLLQDERYRIMWPSSNVCILQWLMSCDFWHILHCSLC
jgi:hypothetical protein